MPVFFSHAKTDENGIRTGSKLLADHIFGVLEKARVRSYRDTRFPDFSPELISELIRNICLLHDLGKYISYFQNYLLDRGHSPEFHDLKSHARFGALAILQQYTIQDQRLAYLTYFVILCHHRNLFTPDNEESDRLMSFDERKYLETLHRQQAQTVTPHLEAIEKELGVNGLAEWVNFPDGRTLAKWVKRWLKREADIQHYFLINFLFSLLIEGDKLDASDTDLWVSKFIPPLSVDRFIGNIDAKDNFQNNLRNQVRQEVVAVLQKGDIPEQRIFILTAPTGIGKTLTALDFALRLRSRLEHHPQIIVGLPFINIIEQTLDVYQKVLPGNVAEILGHYQYADIFGPQSDNSQAEEKGYSTRRMELDTWQADIVITSFVQLLQTMVTNRNKLLLKFNHLAGTIVIMDEVQSIPLKLVPFVGAVIYYMSRFLNTRFLLMTATKPLIFELADEHLLIPFFNESVKKQVCELLADPESIFRQFERTQIVPHLEQQLGQTEDFLPLFKEYWDTSKSCLVVCNTVNRSIEVFELLSKTLGSPENPIFYLSTNVLPLLRLGVISEIKDLLKHGEVKPILVATQVVEAGVDLDFDMGFRDLGPIDSIVQVAGRINRENSVARKFSPIHIFDFGDCHRIYDQLTDSQARRALGHAPTPEPDYYPLVEKYFKAVGGRKAYDDSRRLFKGLLHLQYDLNKLDDTLAINQFRLIKDSPNVATVFVEWEINGGQAGKLARQAFIARLNARNRQEKFRLKEIFEKNHKRDFHGRTLAIPLKYCEGLPLLDPLHPGVQIYYVSPHALPDWYQLPVGFNRERNQVEWDEANKSIQL